MITLNPLQRRRIAAFKANRRAYWSLWIFLVIFGLSLIAELIANDKPLIVSYRGELTYPVTGGSYEESDFGGDPGFNVNFKDDAIECLIVTGGLIDCYDFPEELIADAEDGIVDGQPIEKGWILWPIVPYSYDTVNDDVPTSVSPPDGNHWLGTDDVTRDVLARVIYGTRTSLLFALAVVTLSTIIGIAAGAVQGYFGGALDLFFQRFIEIWSGVPFLYVLIITASIFTTNFWMLVLLMSAFSWTALVGVVRAEFLRARNFEYVRAARALGVSDRVIMFRHILPNAMVATLTLLPFLVTGAIGGLATLDFLGFGLPPTSPSLGELTLQARNYLYATWLGLTAFFSFAILLSLLVFIFEGVRDAFDPRKVMK